MERERKTWERFFFLWENLDIGHRLQPMSIRQSPCQASKICQGKSLSLWPEEIFQYLLNFPQFSYRSIPVPAQFSIVFLQKYSSTCSIFHSFLAEIFQYLLNFSQFSDKNIPVPAQFFSFLTKIFQYLLNFPQLSYRNIPVLMDPFGKKVFNFDVHGLSIETDPFQKFNLIVILCLFVNEFIHSFSSIFHSFFTEIFQ